MPMLGKIGSGPKDEMETQVRRASDVHVTERQPLVALEVDRWLTHREG